MTTQFDKIENFQQNIMLSFNSDLTPINLNTDIKNIVSIKHIKTFIKFYTNRVIGDIILIRINDFNIIDFYHENNCINNIFLTIPVYDENILLINNKNNNIEYKPNPIIHKLSKISIEILDKDGNSMKELIENIYIELTISSRINDNF
jgi:hypothetical protein